MFILIQEKKKKNPQIKMRGQLQGSAVTLQSEDLIFSSNFKSQNIFKPCAPSSGLMEDPQGEGNF